MPAQPHPIGKVTTSTPSSVTFELDQSQPNLHIRHGTIVQTTSIHPPTNAYASVRGPITDTGPTSATFAILHTRVNSQWPPGASLAKPGAHVYTATPAAKKKGAHQRSNRNRSISRPTQFLKSPIVLTCNNCQEILNALTNRPGDQEPSTQNKITCPHCFNVTTVTLLQTPNVVTSDPPLIKCRRTKHNFLTFHQAETDLEFYACPYCATRKSRHRIPPFLIKDETDQLVKYAAVDAALRNQRIFINPYPTPQRLSHHLEFTDFLLSQVNHRKQTLIDIAEKPYVPYRSIAESMDLLLHYQRQLEWAHTALADNPPDPSMYPNSNDPSLTRQVLNTVLDKVYITKTEAILQYHTPLFNWEDPETPSFTRNIKLIEAI